VNRLQINDFTKNTYIFFKHELWGLDLSGKSRIKRFLFRQLRIWVLAIRGFIKDKCALHASALTYYSLLSIIPVLALIFGISKGFGTHDTIRDELEEELAAHKEVIDWIVRQADSLLSITSTGLVTAVGIVLLIWTALKVLSNIEETLNAIWGVKRSRTVIRKFSDYLSIMIIGPLIFFFSSSLAVYLASQVTDLTQKTELAELVNPVVYYLIELTPLFLIWILFTLTFMIIPNTKVNFKPALLGAIISGTFYHWVQLFYIDFQIGATRYSTVYGTFAALPLFLIWLQLSWFIVLFGAELTYAFQHISTYIFEKESGNISGFNKKVLALHIAWLIIKNFENGERPLTEREISNRVKISNNLAHELITHLHQSGVISQVIRGRKRAMAYQPAQDIKLITVAGVLNALDIYGRNNRVMNASELQEKFKETLTNFNQTLLKSKKNMLLKDL
jgi:membrane protein